MIHDSPKVFEVMRRLNWLRVRSTKQRVQKWVCICLLHCLQNSMVSCSSKTRHPKVKFRLLEQKHSTAMGQRMTCHWSRYQINSDKLMQQMAVSAELWRHKAFVWRRVMHAFCTCKWEEQPGTVCLQVCTSKLASFAPDFTRGGGFTA